MADTQKIKIEAAAFNQFIRSHYIGPGDHRAQRLGQALYNEFFSEGYGPCPRLFNVADRDFWSVVFEYVEIE